MDKVRQYIALTVVGALVLAAAGWFLLISPKRTEAADLRTQVDQQATANGALRTQLSVLKAQAKALPAKQAQLARVAAKIPDNPALPTLIRALQKAALASNVELVSLAPAVPVDLVGAAPAAVTPTAAPVAPAAAAAGAPVAPVAAPSAGLKQIDLSLNVVGGYFQVEQFLDQVESLARAMKVKSLAVAPGTNPLIQGGSGVETADKTLSATITATVYLAPGRVALATAPAVGK